MINHFLGVGLVLALFFVRAEEKVDLRYFKDYLFILLTVISIMMFGINTIKRRMWPIIVLTIYSFVFIQRSDNFPIYYQWTMFLFGMVLLYQLGSIKLKEEIILNYLSIAVLICSMWCILEYHGVDIFKQIYRFIGLDNANRVRYIGGVLTPMNNVDVSGPLGQPTITGALIGSCLVSLFRKKWFYLAPIALYGLYVCHSAMSVIAFVATVLLFCCSIIKSPKKIVIFMSFITGLFISSYIYFQDFFNDSGRFVTWLKILKVYGFNFWGKSTGWFWAVSGIKNPQGERFAHCHMEIMDLYIAFGIIGLILFGILLLRVRITNIYIFAIFMGLLVNSLANLTFHISVLSYVAIICYSILTYESMEDSHGNFKHENKGYQFWKR